MPAEHRGEPDLLEAVARALSGSGTAVLDASHELLAHYSDTGDGPTQQAVNTMIDHAADALQALTDCLADVSDALQATTAGTTEADGPSAHPGHGRDH
jgi:hypothetical protein